MKATGKAAESEILSKNFQTLKELIAEGMQDIAERRISEWNFEKFLPRARASAGK
jgi:hypothetical protein